MSTKKLQATYDQALDNAYKIQAEKDAALAAVKDEYGDQLRTANDEAAAAHKVLLDAQAADALLARITSDDPDQREAQRQDATAVADSLGLTLPE